MRAHVLAPFDATKVLYHVARWSTIVRGDIPPPVLVTLDPIQRCNLACTWCNSRATIEATGRMYADDTIAKIPAMLADWGVRAVCIAGGGEPLLHPRIDILLRGLTAAGIEVGIVTNGTRLDRWLDVLGLCCWVGISVDAGTAEEYAALKGADAFEQVLRNIASLRAAHPDLEVTYKYLISPENILGMPAAARAADELGCTWFHARPAGVCWGDIAKDPDHRTLFAPHEVELGARLLAALEANSWPNGLRVAGTSGKFDAKTWAIVHDFRRCRAVGMTCAIQANGRVSLCCDRRGDPRVELCSWGTLSDIVAAWGGEHHLRILRGIQLAHCPRCTYAPHNRLFEAFVDRDDSCKNFI